MDPSADNLRIRNNPEETRDNKSAYSQLWIYAALQHRSTQAIRMKPYAETIEILRSALKKAEYDAFLHQNDPQGVDLRDSLQRMLSDLESASQPPTRLGVLSDGHVAS